MQENTQNLETYLLPQEVADKLQIGLSTVYHLAHRGELPGIKVGGTLRFSPSTLVKYLRNLEVQALGKVA